MRTAAYVACAFAVLLASGCSMTRSPAPVDDRRPSQIPAPRPPAAEQTPVPGAPAVSAVPMRGVHIVRRGDTLYSIALENGADYRDVARWNGLEDPSKLRVGQALRVTPPEGESGVQVGGAARRPGEIESRPLGSPAPGAPSASAPVPMGTKDGPKALRLPYSEQNVALLSGAKPEAPKPAVAAAPDRDPDAIDFAWPAKGRILAGFSEATNKGVDISGKPGDPVLAAAPGRVMYTGTGIRGYGQLIVIKHDNNFNSVYAHNRAILVKEGQNVTKGQRIAELGDTDSDAPKLHFEIRKSGKPVDPLRYLPQP